MENSFDERMMRRCLDLAKNGLGRTYPNPMVGCVIVRDGKIIGEGWHRKAGTPHAEVNAIAQVENKELLKTSTLYVTLEPCSHYGKTPPCADLIIDCGIPRVVIATADPNPKVAGRGIQKLKEAGIEVDYGILEEESIQLNKRFFTYHQKKRPYIILKWAQTADAYMAPEDGGQQWITGPYAKQLVHLWRTEEEAILVGRKTAEEDNPRLSARLWEGNQPIRVVPDKAMNLSGELHLFDKSQRTLVITEKEAEDEENLEYIRTDFSMGYAKALVSAMYKKKIESVIVEGGARTLEAFIADDLWDEIRIFTSGTQWGKGISSPQFQGTLIQTEKIGDDLLQIYLP